MKADHLSYARATNVSLAFAALQLGAGLVMLIHGALNNNMVTFPGGLIILIGVAVWIMLAVLFDGHRRERIEAMETEALSRSGARDGSVFESSDAELMVSARRLNTIHRVIIPASSLAIALLFIFTGLWRMHIWPFGPWSFAPIGEMTGPDTVVPGTLLWWPLGMGIFFAVAGFIGARFVSGMAKQEMWSPLRAGAAQSAAVALIGASIALCYFLNYVANLDIPLSYLQAALPIVSVALGFEITLNFVLTVYRPRRAGEIPRPAFDSRVLAFVAAPDRIAESFGEALSYQFGIDITSSWFYKLLSRTLALLVAIAIGVVWVLTIIGVVGPSEQGLLLRTGKLVGGGQPLQPGFHLKLPFPLDRIDRTVTTSLRSISLASGPPTEAEAILWTNKHSSDEQYMIARPAKLVGDGRDSNVSRVVRDIALVSTEAVVMYTVDDLLAYETLAPPRMRDDLLKAVGARELTTYLAGKHVDDVLGSGRASSSTELKALIQKAYDGLNGGKGAGVTISFAGILGSHPPTSTASAFEKIVEAGQSSTAVMELAREARIQSLTQAVGNLDLAERVTDQIDALNSMRNAGADEQTVRRQELLVEDMLISAGGKAAAMIAEAKASRWVLHMDARRRATEYGGQLAAFEAAPTAYVADTYFQTWKEILSSTGRIYVTPPNIQTRVDLKDEGSTGNALRALTSDGP